MQSETTLQGRHDHTYQYDTYHNPHNSRYSGRVYMLTCDHERPSQCRVKLHLLHLCTLHIYPSPEHSQTHFAQLDQSRTSPNHATPQDTPLIETSCSNFCNFCNFGNLSNSTKVLSILIVATTQSRGCQLTHSLRHTPSDTTWSCAQPKSYNTHHMI